MARRIRISSKIGNITVSGILEVTHNHSASVTTHPVEDGSLVTDNVIVNPKTLNISILNTECYVNGVRSSSNQEVFSRLYSMLNNRNKHTIITKYKSYRDMVLTSFNINENAETQNSLVAGLVFDEIRTVSLATASVKGKSNAPQTSGKTQTGVQQAQALPPATPPKNNASGTSSGSQNSSSGTNQSALYNLGLGAGKKDKGKL